MRAGGKDSRNAATAGKVWMMSPSEPSRTTRKRGSDMRSLAHGIEESARRVILRVTDNRYADTEAGGRRTPRDGLGSVICSLGMHIRTQVLQQRLHVGLTEDYDIIDSSQRTHQRSTRSFGQDGAPGAFQTTDTRIRIHRNSQDIAFVPSAFEIPDMAYMQRVEAAVRQHNFLGAPPMLRK